MKVRRSLTTRTAAIHPRGIRRTRSATALLLSFALLCTAFSLSTPLRSDRAGARANASRIGFTSKPTRRAPGLAFGAVGRDSLTRSAEMPPPPRPRIHPKRTLAAVSQESSAKSVARFAIPADRIAVARDVAQARIPLEPVESLPSHASKTSRTRGPPVSG